MSGIAENLAMVRDKIARAAEKAGRRGDDVRLIAVTKTRCVAEINEAIRCGVSDIGENYVQESAAKYAEVADGVRWHMIGHLQRNKVSSALRVFDVIQSVDSVELGREISKRASSSGKCVELLIEARISEEISKSGVDLDAAEDLAACLSGLPGVKVCGYMGMAPFTENESDVRKAFRSLKSLWDKLPSEQRLWLSMGMTGDFETAIEEGSNMVRIGTAIFGPRTN